MSLLAMTGIPTAQAVPWINLIPQVHLGSLLWFYAPFQILMFRSALLGRVEHHYSHGKHIHFIFESVLTAHTLLLMTLYSNIPFRTRLDGILSGLKAGKGNNAGQKVAVGYADEDTDAYIVQPNPAEPRSIMARALFSHVVPIVLRHYKKPMQLRDIPALREDDTPSVSAANWRLAQIEDSAQKQKSGKTGKKPTRLAFRLFWHFRYLFLLQSFWSVLAVAFSFGPPVGLLLLLQFIAQRKAQDKDSESSTPTHVAVLYVALMVVGQVGCSISQSQILNAGRRICIRLRALIITEIYCKALRRRDMSGAVSSRIESKATNAVDANKKPIKPDAATAEPEVKPQANPVEANITNLVGVDAFYICK